MVTDNEKKQIPTIKDTKNKQYLFIKELQIYFLMKIKV